MRSEWFIVPQSGSQFLHDAVLPEKNYYQLLLVKLLIRTESVSIHKENERE